VTSVFQGQAAGRSARGREREAVVDPGHPDAGYAPEMSEAEVEEIRDEIRQQLGGIKYRGEP